MPDATADAGRQLLPFVAYNGHHAPVSGKGDAAESLPAVRQRTRRAHCVLGSGVEKFPGTYDGLRPVFSRGNAFLEATVEDDIRPTWLGPGDV